MKTFTKYLTESDYKRFLKKNKNLSKDQIEKINTYFSKTNTQAASEIQWQDRKIKTLTYDYFEDIMIKYKSGRKKKLKCSAIKVKGLTAGDDYVHVIMKTKEYCAYIPLNFDAAQRFNTKELGICSGPWCIGHSGTPYHWNEEVVEGLQVPVYVVNKYSKWVVMIYEGNRKHDVWAIENNPVKVREGIPNFSIRKELLNPKQKAMYDEIREDYYEDQPERIEIDIDDAVIDYDKLIEDIDEAKEAWERAYEEFHEKISTIKYGTKEKYEEEDYEMGEIVEKLENAIEYYEDLTTNEPDEVDEDDNDEEYWKDKDEGMLTQSEIDDRISEAKSELEEAEGELSDIREIIEKIDEIEYYEMDDSDIDWTDYVPSEENMYDDVNMPYLSNGAYSDYIDLLEEHAGWSMRFNGDRAQGDINSYVMEDTGYDASSILSENEMHHPEYIQEMLNE